MEHSETLSHVTRLLELRPDVKVTGLRDMPQCTWIQLSVGSSESLARLAPITYAANIILSVHLEQWTVPSPKAPRPDLLRYELRIPNRGDERDDLERLGVMLVNHLHAGGLLAADEAASLCEAWNTWPPRSGTSDSD